MDMAQRASNSEAFARSISDPALRLALGIGAIIPGELGSADGVGGAPIRRVERHVSISAREKYRRLLILQGDGNSRILSADHEKTVLVEIPRSRATCLFVTHSSN
jgi:hypothetical protein